MEGLLSTGPTPSSFDKKFSLDKDINNGKQMFSNKGLFCELLIKIVTIFWNAFFWAKLTDMHFWALTKVFEDTEKVSIRYNYGFQTSMKCLLKLFQPGINKL